jgi:hypothetical protein
MNLSFSMSQVAAAAKYHQLPDVKTAGTVCSSGTHGMARTPGNDSPRAGWDDGSPRAGWDDGSAE